MNSSWEPSNKSSDYQRFLAAGAMPFQIRGRGDFAGCDRAVRRALKGFDRAGQPALKQTPGVARFVAMSLFFYAEHFAAVAGHLRQGVATSTVSASQLREAAKSLCELDDVRLRRLVGVDPLTTEDALRWRCFDLTYASRLLTDGYGFDDAAAIIDFMGDIDGVEVEWTLGALLDKISSARGANSHGAASGGAKNAGLRTSAAAASDPTSRSTAQLSADVGSPFIMVVLCVVCAAVFALGQRSCTSRNHNRAARSRLLSKW